MEIPTKPGAPDYAPGIAVDAARLLVPGSGKRGETGKGSAADGGPAAPTPPFPPLPLSAGPAREVAPAASEGGEVYFPAPIANPVIAALKHAGLYRRPTEDGRHEIECAWAHQHGHGDSGNASYCEPTDHAPHGTFFCPHEHGGTPRITDLLGHLDIDRKAARCRPTIRLIQGELHQIVDWSEKLLAETGDFYQAGGTIVSVRVDPASGDLSTELASEATLARALSRAVDWEKFDGRSVKWTRCDPQPRYLQTLLRGRSYNHLPLLEGLARQPYFRADGSFSTEPGYDAQARIFGDFDRTAYSLPDPTPEAARHAFGQLNGLLEEFPFASVIDRTAAISAMLTAAVRGSLPFAPAFNITASGPGSGKSYLASLLALFAGPGEPMNIGYPTTPEEATKALLAALIPKPAVVLFDDMQTDWKPFSMINKVLTSKTVTERLLGGNRTQTVSTASLFMGTGNNVSPVRDMCRRVVTIHLASTSENPALTRYDKRPVDIVRSDRERYVGYALTIIRAWKAAGGPKAKVPNIVTFGDDWSDYCRQPLLWLDGENDPAGSLIQQQIADPDKDVLAAFLAAWLYEFGHSAVTVRKVVLAADAGAELSDAIADLPLIVERDKINRNKLGWYLKQNENRVAGGYKVVKANLSERNGWAVIPSSGDIQPGAPYKMPPAEAAFARRKNSGPVIDPTDEF